VRSDRDAICELIFTYAERIDAGDFEGLADLFAEAEISTEGLDQVSRGRDEVLATYTNWTRRFDDGTPKTKHVMTNLIVEVDETSATATSRSYFTVLQAVPGALALQPIVAGRYRDRFVRVDAEWRFASMHIMIDLVGDLGQHGLSPLGVEGSPAS
jgi:SnoaL-like domain